MRLLHCSDLHIGKKLNGHELLDDQTYLLNQISKWIETLSVDCLLIAGDIYDKKNPSAEAIKIFDAFLTQLIEKNISVFVIAGNHDCPEKINFAASVLSKHNFHMAGHIEVPLHHVTLWDAFGPVHVYMMPYFYAASVKKLKGDVSSYQEAFDMLIANTKWNKKERNVLLSHQFYVKKGTDPFLSDSEINVGGLYEIDAASLQMFDYVALGHLHRAQFLFRHVAYSGSVLGYSVSESDLEKSVIFIELKEKNNIETKKIALQPLRKLVTYRGSLQEILSLPPSDDFVHILLKEEHFSTEPLARIRQLFPNVVSMENEWMRKKINSSKTPISMHQEKDLLENFAEFYELQRGETIAESDVLFLQKMIREISLI